MKKRHIDAAAMLLASTLPAALAAAQTEFLFDTDPFAGTTALTDPGRQIIGNELFINAFNFDTDAFVFDNGVFDIGPDISFFNGLAGDIPDAAFNVIVLQSIDNDNNPATPFLAGTAANLIAASIDVDGAGFFVYHNSNLGLNRLVYSTNLNDATADLRIIARLTDQPGADAIGVLPSFSAANFRVVPAPASAAALAGAALVMTRRRRA